MLKIKDNINLIELEKLGFSEMYMEGIWCYKYNYGYLPCYIIVNPYNCKKNQLVFCIDEVLYADDVYEHESEVFDLDVIFDLIQAGLVEKVEE